MIWVNLIIVATIYISVGYLLYIAKLDEYFELRDVLFFWPLIVTVSILAYIFGFVRGVFDRHRRRN